MNVKLHLTFADLLKLILGGSVIVCDRFNNSIIKVKKGDETIVTK